MKIKLKEGECLESSGSHQGFPFNIWANLNAGETVEVESIPSRAINRVVEVTTKKKVVKPTTKKKEGVKNGK